MSFDLDRPMSSVLAEKMNECNSLRRDLRKAERMAKAEGRRADLLAEHLNDIRRWAHACGHILPNGL